MKTLGSVKKPVTKSYYMIPSRMGKSTETERSGLPRAGRRGHGESLLMGTGFLHPLGIIKKF